MRKITEQVFDKVKKDLHWYVRTWAVASRFDLSVKTITQIKCSKDFEEYREQCQAQHPPTIYSLKDEILELHRLTFRKDNTYIAPPTARKAVAELQAHV